MNKLAFCILIILASTTFIHCQIQPTKSAAQDEYRQAIANKISELESYRGIKILDEGPAGRKHNNSKRGEFGVTKMRITIINDTIVPIELEVKFPPNQSSSIPEPSYKVQIWILPDELTPKNFVNARDFGIVGLEEHFNSDFTDPGFVKTIIQPKEDYTFYIASMGESPFTFGSSYPKLFINGQDVDTPYLQDKSIKTTNTDGSLDLIFGIGHTPHNLYTLIPCGKITFLK